MSPSGENKSGGLPRSDSSTPSPRAFAIGAGVVFQSVGGILALAALVAALISPWAIPRSEKPVEQWFQFFEKDHLPYAMAAIVIITSLIGGLAFVAVGLGLQGERRSSGRVAMVTAGLIGATYLGVACVFLFLLNRPFSMIVPTILTLICVALYLLAGHSASILRQFPPPPDLSVATPEVLEEFRQKRMERLKQFEP